MYLHFCDQDTSLGEDCQRIEAYHAMGHLRWKCLNDSDPEDFKPEIALQKGMKFTEEEERILRKFFEDTGKASLDIARKCLKLHPEINRTPKQVQD